MANLSKRLMLEQMKEGQLMINYLRCVGALTKTFLALLALIDHAEEQMAFSSKNRIDSHLELNIAIEDV